MIPLPEDMLDLITDYVKSKIKIKNNRMATIDPGYRADRFPEQLPRVVFDGESTVSGKRYSVLGDYTPLPGHRVLMVPVGSNYVITGPVSGKNSSIQDKIISHNLFDISNETINDTDSFVDLATPGPEVTAFTGKKALVFLSCELWAESSGTYSQIGVQVSKATTISASLDRALNNRGTESINTTKMVYFDELNSGYNTFTAKYRTNGGIGNFQRRQIEVIPL